MLPGMVASLLVHLMHREIDEEEMALIGRAEV
jgi:hypothetical protein